MQVNGRDAPLADSLDAQEMERNRSSALFTAEVSTNFGADALTFDEAKFEIA